MKKSWPRRELNGLVAREIDGQNRILPIWHEVGRGEVAEFSPTLADKIAVRTEDASAIDIALQVLAEIRPDLYSKHPRAELERLASGEAIAVMQAELNSLREQLSEFQCPYCHSQLVGSIDAPLDPGEKHWDVIRTLECGYEEFGGTKQRLCPKDPEFPKFEEYELQFHEDRNGASVAQWVCSAWPMTTAARLVRLPQTFGRTREQAAKAMRHEYDKRTNSG